MTSGTAPVNQAEGATSATLDGKEFVYTVWSVDDVQARVYAYHRSLSDKSAREVAELINGVVTREEVIGDFRKQVRV